MSILNFVDEFLNRLESELGSPPAAKANKTAARLASVDPVARERLNHALMSPAVKIRKTVSRDVRINQREVRFRDVKQTTYSFAAEDPRKIDAELLARVPHSSARELTAITLSAANRGLEAKELFSAVADRLLNSYEMGSVRRIDRLNVEHIIPIAWAFVITGNFENRILACLLNKLSRICDEEQRARRSWLSTEEASKLYQIYLSLEFESETNKNLFMPHFKYEIDRIKAILSADNPADFLLLEKQPYSRGLQKFRERIFPFVPISHKFARFAT